MKLDNLLKKDIKIVQNRKKIFIVPLCFLLVGIIAGLIFFFRTGSPFNLGMDFTGGYTITVKAGSTLTDSNYDEYKNEIETLVNDYRYEYNGKEYGVQLEEIKKLGSGTETSMRVEYRADKDLSGTFRDEVMEELNEDLVSTLNGVVGFLSPTSVVIQNNSATVTYDRAVRAHIEDGTYANLLQKAGINLANSNFSFATENDEIDYRTVTFFFNGNPTEQEIKTAVTLEVPFAAQAINGDMISGTISNDLIYNAILAVLIALILLLVYIFIRFEFASGVATVVALFHDLMFMFIMVTVFHIQISSTFIAAIITVLGYSINNTIIIFDRVRENRNGVFAIGGKATATDIANKSIKESLTRNIVTSITTLIMIGMIAVVCGIAGITEMVNFAVPIILGLVAGFYSAVFIAPSLWVVLRRNELGVPRAGRVQTLRKKDTPTEAVDAGR